MNPRTRKAILSSCFGNFSLREKRRRGDFFRGSFSRACAAFALFLSLAFPARAVETVAGPGPGAVLTDALWLKFRSLPRSRRPKVALVLSGGGARGLAHIGVLKVLERERVPVDLIVGTSVGALVGALYAAGLPAASIESMAAEAGWEKLTDLSATRVVQLLVTERLLSTKNMESYLQARIGDKQFADLATEFACVAADLRTGESVVLREGSVALAARASATMPGVFEPVQYRHRQLIDGGVVDNVPTDIARRLGADVLICVFVPADFSQHKTINVLTTITQALYIQGQVISEERLKLADFIVKPDVAAISALELWRSAECMEAGQRAAEAAWPDLKRLLTEKFFERVMAPSEKAPGSRP